MTYFHCDVPDIVLKSLFMKYDKDGGGTLCSDELKLLLKEDLGMNEEQANTYALLLDKDGDKTVSFDEFTSWLRSGEKFKTVNDSSRYHRVKKAVEMFMKYDKDKSQGLDYGEFRQLHLDVGGKPDQVEAALKALDHDGNGTISFVEFLKWLNWVPMDDFK